MTPTKNHIPVLLQEVLSFFPTHAQYFIDGTVGNGGHARAILEAFPQTHCIGLDKDTEAINRTRVHLQNFADRVTLVQASYERIPGILAEEGVKKTDCILLDLGFSSPQIDDPKRGLSFIHDGPLDMRYDTSQQLTAQYILNQWDEQDIARLLHEFGEEPLYKHIAHAIIQKRKTKIFETTTELSNVILDAYREKLKSKKEIPWIGGKHPATRVFQALRIAVNDELHALSRTLQKLLPLINEKGRIIIITFHSLEDRIVKHFYKYEARGCLCPPELPKCICDHDPQIRILTKKGITALPEEQKINPRSRSARLRVAEKI